MENNKRSRCMRLSWDIQIRKHKTRSQALTAAWAIMNNEELTIYYLIQRYNRGGQVAPQVRNQMALFNH